MGVYVTMSHWKKLLKKCASVQGGDIERKMENISYSVKGIL